MKLTARTAVLQLTEPFRISREAYEEVSVIQVRITHAGVSGFGEGAPNIRYGESAASALSWFESVVLGDDPFALDEIAERLPPGNYAARAALDSALHDLQGKLTQLPVFRLLGLKPPSQPTCWTVWLGDPDEMARRSEAAAKLGYRRLKLKLGGKDGLDLERVRAVRAAVRDLPLQCDANEAWTLEEAVEILAQADLDLCEQPLPARDPDALTLKQRASVPIYADEDCLRLEDVSACVERAHGINIKLTKAGGIREALRMCHAARALKLGVMLGCMTESGLGIAAGAHVSSLADFVDLDGNLVLRNDPCPGPLLRGGVQIPRLEPGLGVTDASRNWTRERPQRT